MSCWAIPEARLAEIDQGLADIRNEFNFSKEEFLKRYEKTVEDWINSHPQWSGIIANSVVSEDYVRYRLDFKWQIFRVATPQENGCMRDNLDEDVQNLGNTLFDEIAKEGNEIWHKCYEGKTEITRKALSPLKSLYDKLMGLTFVEPRVTTVASLIKTAFESIPARGPIKGATLLMLQGLVCLLRMPKELLEHGQKILNGQMASDILSGISGITFNIQEASLESTEEQMPDLCLDTQSPVLESCGLW